MTCVNAAVRSAAVLVWITAINVVAQRSRVPADVAVPVGTALVAAGAVASGVTLEEMGVDAAALGAGVVPAGVAAGVIAGAVVGLARVPAAEPFRSDGRYPDARTARRGALVSIPLAVAIPEEVLFRGVLEASLRRHLGPVGSGVVGCAAFGLWHALGASMLTRGNEGVAAVLGERRGAQAAGVAGVVVATGVAGAGFLALRRGSGSLLPSAAVHWALNAASALAAGLQRQ